MINRKSAWKSACSKKERNLFCPYHWWKARWKCNFRWLLQCYGIFSTTNGDLERRSTEWKMEGLFILCAKDQVLEVNLFNILASTRPSIGHKARLDVSVAQQSRPCDCVHKQCTPNTHIKSSYPACAPLKMPESSYIKHLWSHINNDLSFRWFKWFRDQWLQGRIPLIHWWSHSAY